MSLVALALSLGCGDLSPRLGAESVVAFDQQCSGIVCPMGQVCKAGVCVAGDPCLGVVCPMGQVCVGGNCVIANPCNGVVCPAGQVCVNGQCTVPADLGAPADLAAPPRDMHHPHHDCGNGQGPEPPDLSQPHRCHHDDDP
jgi:hypothetical protein